ncbi:MAG TPA: hypothetical protein VHL77_05140, partial [Ferruginibacter sp.]|nr:hypothetical protein [Ferruginibacter sp.]
MPSILKYLRQFYYDEFKLGYFLVIICLLGICIYLNYWHDLEYRYVAGGETKARDFLGYYLLYLVPFAAAFFLQPLFFKNCSYFRNRWFWIILLLAPAFFSFRVNFDLHHTIIKKIWAGDEQEFWTKSLNWVVRVFVVMIPVFILWLVKDKHKQPFYGTKKMDNVKPYLLMLLVMVPLIALASTQNDFLAMYPKAKKMGLLNLSPKNLYYIIYELCYGFDFVSIELFFRGFLILSLAAICGKRCIIPVACFYCTIHFGKPMGEAISSFWGGLLLG